MDDTGRIFRGIAADLVDALCAAAAAHDAAATETEDDWLRILLEECARDRRRLAANLADAVEAWTVEQLISHAEPRDPTALLELARRTEHPPRAHSLPPPLVADVGSAREQALSAMGACDAEVERHFGLALGHQPARALGELLRRQYEALSSSRGRMTELRRRDRLSKRR
jgi:hypothetical protein